MRLTSRGMRLARVGCIVAVIASIGFVGEALGMGDPPARGADERGRSVYEIRETVATTMPWRVVFRRCDGTSIDSARFVRTDDQGRAVMRCAAA